MLWVVEWINDLLDANRKGDFMRRNKHGINTMLSTFEGGGLNDRNDLMNIKIIHT